MLYFVLFYMVEIDRNGGFRLSNASEAFQGRVVSLERGRESRICDIGRFQAGNERVTEIWMMRVANQKRKMM